MLLVCFTPGARGDFLASVLLNRQFKSKLIIDTPVGGYRKVHWIKDRRYGDDFNLLDPDTDLPGYTSVRIGCNSDLEFAKLIYRRYNKPLWYEPDLRLELSNCIEQESNNRLYDLQFNYSISLDLFDRIEKLKEFYFQFNEIEMPAFIEKPAVANIELNQCQGKPWKKFLTRFKTELHDFTWPSWVRTGLV